MRSPRTSLVCMLALVGCPGDARNPPPGAGEGSSSESTGAVASTSSGSESATGTSSNTSDKDGGSSSTGVASESETTGAADGNPFRYDLGLVPDVNPAWVPECECAPGTDLVYVLSDDAELWSFDPETYQFALVSAFACNGMTNMFSMGVDRNAIAWVMFQNGDIYNIDIHDPISCTDPGYTPGQGGFTQFGMAFVSESEDNPCDQLYAFRYNGGGFQEGVGIGRLGTIEPETLQLVDLGATDYNGGELTGTGDGRLFAFTGSAPAKLVEFDKTDASVLDIFPLASLELTNAFAFAFFGGDFYFFTEGLGLNSQVTHLDYDDSDEDGQQELTQVALAPIRVVGAGVSTCAPFLPPVPQ